MTYKSVVLQNFPAGYWENVVIGDNQYLGYPTAWTPSVSTVLDELYIDQYVDGYGQGIITATATDTSAIEFELNSANKIQLNQGGYYTMVAYIKSGQGSRTCAINVKYTTTQSGDTLVQSEFTSDYFTISDSEYTAVYITDQAPYGVSTDVWAAWGIITDTGDANDYILIQPVDFFQGYPFIYEDSVSTNDGRIQNYSNVTSKPLVFGTGNPVVIDDSSFVEIPNTYNMFISGTEDKVFSLDFWFSSSSRPRLRHNILSISGVIDCYIEDDQIFIDSSGNRAGLRIENLGKQHYVYIEYEGRKFSLVLDNSDSTSIYLDENFYFPELINNEAPQIILGPASESNNMINNSSFNLDTDFWDSQNSSIQVINTDSYSGESCLEITKNSLDDSGIKQSDLIKIDPYNKYSLSAYVKIPIGSESSELSLVCNVYDSIDSPILITSYSDTINLTDSNNWQRLQISFIPDVYSQYAEILIIQETAGTVNEMFLVDSVLMEKQYQPSSWSEDFARSEYIFFTGLGIYKHKLSQQNIINRIRYASKKPVDALDVKFNADRFELGYDKKYKVDLFEPLNINDINNADMNNFISLSNTMQMIKISDPEIYVGPAGGYTLIDYFGAKFNTDSYIKISASDCKFSPLNSSIRLQLQLDDSSGDGTIITIYPMLLSYALVLEKVSNTIVLKNVSDYAGTAYTNLFQTTALSSGTINIALNFSDGYIDAYVDGQEFYDLEIPAIGSDPQIVIGNLPGAEYPCPDYVRNFSVDDVIDFSNINWIELSRYTLRLNGNINVSQRSTYTYESLIPNQSNNALITINNSTNSNILVNSQYIKDSGHIPLYNYESPDNITLEIISETEDSFEKTRIIKDIYMFTYDNSLLDSNYANFSLIPNTSGSNYLNNSYIPKTDEMNILSKGKNIGIKFDKLNSTGAVVRSNAVSYRYLEFIFKLNTLPNASEEFYLFNTIDSITTSLSFTDNNVLSKNGTYTVYIDGVEYIDPSLASIDVNNIYHVFIDFGSEISDNIYLGCDSSLSNVLDGSFGRLVLYTNNIPSAEELALSRYNNIFNPILHSISGGSLTINDESESQTYIRDSYNEYYEMESLPKVKIYVR